MRDRLTSVEGVRVANLSGGFSHWWLGPLFLFIVSRVALFAVVWTGLFLRPLPEERARINYEKVPGNTYGDTSIAEAPALVSGLAKWDAAWYESIWRDGYSYEVANTRKCNVNFFPGYPLTVGGAVRLTGAPCDGEADYLVAEILSNGLFFAAMLVLYRLVLALGETRQVAMWAVALYAFQPASVFFSAPYSESLCILFAASALLSAKKGRWALAGLFGLLTSGTRITGAALLPALGILWLAAEGVTWRSFIKKEAFVGMIRVLCTKWSWAWLLLIPVGLLAYMTYLGVRFGDGIAFIHSQARWHVVPRGFWIVVPRDLWDVLRHGWPLMSINVAAFFLVAAGAVWAWRRYGAGMGVFSLLVILMPAMGTTSSMLRYAALAIPVFIALAHGLEKRKPLAWSVVILFALGSSYAAYLYSHARFVA